MGQVYRQRNNSQASFTKKAIKYLPNRLTSFNFKIYYKEENYLKVKTTVFKYITPPIVKVQYIGTLVRLVYKYISMQVCLVYA